jgi:hypothetical protein
VISVVSEGVVPFTAIAAFSDLLFFVGTAKPIPA